MAVRVTAVLARSLVVAAETPVADALVPAPRVATHLAVTTIMTLSFARALVHVGAPRVCRVARIGRSEAELAVAAVASGRVDALRVRSTAGQVECALVDICEEKNNRKCINKLETNAEKARM